ncbi:hypothetical protein [Chitinophaga sp. MD30]|uniref:hypothetical protein n=1 Tax=Chitinophaga sp. MD30 TaxID=2033437 RepID=UPI0012FD28BB
MVSRLRRLGYALQPRDIFQHQTIGSLSKLLVSRRDSVSSTHRYSEKIQINCKVQGGRLHIDIRYSGLHYRRESILSLSALYLSGSEHDQ